MTIMKKLIYWKSYQNAAQMQSEYVLLEKWSGQACSTQTYANLQFVKYAVSTKRNKLKP